MSTGPDVDALESAVEESRRSFDKQVAELESIDDKAMRTVRTAVLVLGFVVSAVGIAGPSTFTEVGPIPTLFVALGVLTLFAAAFVGVGTYTATEYSSGIGEDHRTFAGGATHKEWLTQLLAEYNQWSAEIGDEIEANSAYLETMQALLLFGSSNLFVAAVMTVLLGAYDVSPNVTAIGGVAILSLIFLAINLMPSGP